MEDGDDDREEEVGRSGGSVDSAVAVPGVASSAGKNTVEDDMAVAIEELKYVTGVELLLEKADDEDVDVEEEDAEGAALDALSELAGGTHGQSTLKEPISKGVQVPFGARVAL